MKLMVFEGELKRFGLVRPPCPVWPQVIRYDAEPPEA